MGTEANTAAVRRFHAVGPADDDTDRLSCYGRSVETTGAHVFRLDSNARIVEAWGFAAAQAGLDALLDPA